MEDFQYWFTLCWLVAYFIVWMALAGYGFHRLLMVMLYFRYRKAVPKPMEIGRASCRERV